MKAIIFNGAPGSGKDTFGELTVQHLGPISETFSFKSIMFDMLLPIYGVTPDEWFQGYDQTNKNLPWDKLQGRSRREALIHFSEEVLKPAYGKDIFGQIMAYKMKHSIYDIGVFTDGGFVEEIKPIADLVGPENVIIIRLHRPGYTFEGDSRSLLDIEGITTYDVESLGIDETFDAIKKIVEGFLGITD